MTGRPLVLICAGFLCGILCAGAAGFGLFEGLVVLVLAAAIAPLCRSLGARRAVFFSVLPFFIGIVYSILFYISAGMALFPYTNESQVEIIAEVDQVPVDMKIGQSAVVNIYAVNGVKTSGKVQAIAGFTLPEYGIICRMVGRIEELSPEIHTMYNYYTAKGIFYQMRIYEVTPLNETSALIDLKLWALKARTHIRKLTRERLPTDTAQLASGLVTGDTTGMSPEFKAALRACGLQHIVSVSGMHVGMWLGLISTCMVRAGIRPSILTSIATAILMLFLVLITGGSLATIRAVIMVFSMWVAVQFQLSFDKLSALALAALLITLKNPMSAFDVGFQLTSAATLGIILFNQPLLERITVFTKSVNSGLAVSIASQLTLTPLVILHFNTFPLVGALSQFVTLPVIAVAMPASLLYALFPSDFTYFLTNSLVGFVVKYVKIFSDVPLAMVELAEDLGIWFYLVYILFLITLHSYFQLRSSDHDLQPSESGT